MFEVNDSILYFVAKQLLKRSQKEDMWDNPAAFKIVSNNLMTLIDRDLSTFSDAPFSYPEDELTKLYSHLFNFRIVVS